MGRLCVSLSWVRAGFECLGLPRSDIRQKQEKNPFYSFYCLLKVKSNNSWCYLQVLVLFLIFAVSSRGCLAFAGNVIVHLALFVTCSVLMLVGLLCWLENALNIFSKEIFFKQLSCSYAFLRISCFLLFIHSVWQRAKILKMKCFLCEQ